MVSTGATEKGSRAPYWLVPQGTGFTPVGGLIRRVYPTNDRTSRREVMRRGLCPHELGDPKLPRKTSVECTAVLTVPQTDTGGRGEYPKALERTLLKELGKMTP